MELFNTSANEQEKVQTINNVKPHSELIIEQIPTLPLHFKLVLYACASLLVQNKNNMMAALMDVFVEYRRLASDLNIDWLPLNRINNIVKELEMLGFLKCSYNRKRDWQVRFVQFFEPAQIPKYASMLKEELEKVRLEKDFLTSKYLADDFTQST